MSCLVNLFYLEAEKYKQRGLYSILAWVLLFSYFYYLPHFLLSIYSHLPNYSLYTLHTIGSYLVHLFAYTSSNLLFFLTYYTNISFFNTFVKIVPGSWPWAFNKNFYEKIKSLFKCALINQLLIVPPLSLINGFTVKYQINIDQFPSLWINFGQILFFIMIDDIFVYWSHRLLHTPYFYKWIHKQHHEFNMNISMVSEYAHPIEYVIGNIVPIGAGPVLYGQNRVHIITWYLWLMFRSLHTSEGHSGYHVLWSPFRFLPFGASSAFHEEHHLKNVGNFGSIFMIWDTIFDTNQDVKKDKDKAG
ncbi:hypothetical protein SteCoe_5318 [Stentor coeruleus]|uniref:Fatty acid hydroxylase domain-containing protein n=1 Tax=Stentor coeruleus TaxID=5963 RepID=A0A1R2CSM5_9CILI|nr:hypothetical protein SteCoe_5318 [Stentor coeruleus]